MNNTDLTGLPPTFTYQQARAAGMPKHRLYALRDAGMLEQLGHGLFHSGNPVSSQQKTSACIPALQTSSKGLSRP